MKKKSLIAILILYVVLVNAQDIIYKIDGAEIKVKVVEITTENIKYKKFEQLNGPFRNINTSEVFMIIYEDGSKEVFKKKEDKVIENITLPNNNEISYENNVVQNNQKQSNNSYFSIALGGGNSYGGFGIRLNGRIGQNPGIGLHGGVGLFPDAPFLYSGGIKVYLDDAYYFNIQYGTFGVQTVTQTYEYTSWNGYSYVTQYEYTYNKYIIYGPSFLLGADWLGNKNIGFNSSFGISFNLNSSVNKSVFLAGDIGIIFKL